MHADALSVFHYTYLVCYIENGIDDINLYNSGSKIYDCESLVTLKIQTSTFIYCNLKPHLQYQPKGGKHKENHYN